MRKMTALMAILFCGVAQAAEAPQTYSLRPDIADRLNTWKQILNLSESEFLALVVNSQQSELAATTPQPTAEQLQTFAKAMVLNSKCLQAAQARIDASRGKLPPIPNGLEAQERLNNFLKFTGGINRKVIEDQLGQITPQQACDQAAALLRK